MKGMTNAHDLNNYVPSELVTVNVTADNGVLPDGFEITITDSENNVLIVSSESTFSIKIPYNTTYTVSASSVGGYHTPASQTLTAALITRNISMVYKELVYGVYIQDISGNLYTEDGWDGTLTANGVAVLTEQCSFVMALADAYSSTCTWGGSGTTVSGIVTTSDKSTAATDYLGDANTTTIINALKGTNDGFADGAPAAEYCRSYTFPNGATGYLGAAGEWQAALNNKSAIATALTTCGGTAMSSYYWTSTQYGSLDSWYMDWDDEDLDRTFKGNLGYVRAFAAI